MVREAEAHAEEDKRQKELVEARNQADAAIYTAEKTVKEMGSRLDTRGETEQAITTLKEAMKSEDVQRIRQTTERLTQVAMRLGQAAQSTAATAGDWGGHAALGRVRCR
jgi:molecular chaperone DnaK